MTITLSKTGEIGDFLDVDQMQPAKTQFACGYFAFAIIRAMAPVGQAPTQSVQQMIAESEAWYAQDHGTNAISNTDGMSLQEEYDLIIRAGWHYQAIALDVAAIKAWVQAGYPILLTISETSVFDLALGSNPYPWRAAGNHIIVVSGVAADGNFLVRDPANCTDLYNPNSLRPGPRHYAATRLQIWTATVVVPPWLPRPISATPPAQSAPAGQFADISQYQPLAIDWQTYKKWAEQGDSIARLSIRASEGTTVTDMHYHAYRAAAESAGIQLIHYHFADPDLNSPEAEADWMHCVTGPIGPNDAIMLDYEKQISQATAAWALAWLERQEQNYGRTPIIYASTSFVETHLQDSRLARFPLVLANWTYDPSKRPACPAPWQHYMYWQYSDKATVPGIPAPVDVNLFLGGTTMPTNIPAGWRDDGTTLIASNGIPVVLGFRDHILNAASWDAGNVPQGPEYHVDQVLLHNTSVGAGQRQLFRDCELWYTLQKGVVQEPFVGLELDAAYKQIATLQAELAKVAPAQIPATVITDLQALRTSNAVNDAALAKVLIDLGVPA